MVDDARAADVLQVIPQRGPTPPSVVAVGMDVLSKDRAETWESRTIDPTLSARRKRLATVVIATVGACGAILIAAGIARHERTKADVATAAAALTATATPTPTPIATPTPTDAPKTGTLSLDRPAVPGHVWVDGKKLTMTSAMLACGKHQVKVGLWGRAHAVDVPCGGELRVSR
jgi:hypothetical protein